MSIWQDDEFDAQGNERPVGDWGIEEDEDDLDEDEIERLAMLEDSRQRPEGFARELFRQAKEDEDDLSPFDLDS